ncbi:hypothetical protein SDC9_172086 [bioreactor metagenome]|uniref:DNA binding HTH domain-containing protein n=1 Tax=bioreactor metagenome TaxID=1076179 RepID=A0A645GL73_9ZZZZ
MNYLMRIVILSNSHVLTSEDIKKSEIKLSSKHHCSNEVRDESENVLKLSAGSLNSMEQEIISWYMDKYSGNRAMVSQALNISRTTLWKKLKNIK